MLFYLYLSSIIVIVNYNYYKRLHEIINSDKMSTKKKKRKHNLDCVLLRSIVRIMKTAVFGIDTGDEKQGEK